MPNQEEKILEKLKSLKKQVSQLEGRLKALEGEKLPSQPPEPIPYKETLEYPREPEIEKPKPKEKIALLKKKPVDIEEVMGTWLPRIGMLALLFGVGFFLKYAFDHQWIGPTGRVILGLLAGIVLLGAGEYFEGKKYHGYSRVFTGGGLALLYFSLYAARNFYQMIGTDLTFVSMIFVTVAAGFFAVRYNSRIIAFYSIIGGFLTPLLIGYKGLETRISLLSYIAVLNLGILGLAFFKKWRILNLSAFIGTAFLYLATYGRFGARESLSISFGFLTLYFLIFVFVAFLYNILYRMPTHKKDIFLVLANAFYYYVFSYVLLRPDYDNLLGLFTFGLAFFYLILACLAFSRNARDKFLPMVLLGTCVAFITIGIAVQFEQHWLTIFWILEALGLLYIGFQIKEILNRAYVTRFLALVIFILTFIRLLAVHSKIPPEEFIPIFNKRVFVFLLFALSLFLAGALYSYYKEKIRESERKTSTVCIIVANFLIIYLMSVEIIDYFGLKIRKLPGRTITPLPRHYYKARSILLQQRNACLSIGWGFYSIGLIVIGIIKRHKSIRLFALFLFGITTLKVFFVDLSYLKGFSRILSFIILGLILLGAGFLYNKYKEKIREFV